MDFAHHFVLKKDRFRNKCSFCHHSNGWWEN